MPLLGTETEYGIFAPDAAGADPDSDVGQRRVELTLLVESIAMLLTGRPPEQVDERLVTYALGEEFASYVRHAE